MASGDSNPGLFFINEKGSPIWKFFLKGRGESSGFAKCRVVNDDGEFCNSIVSMGKKSSTGSMNNHLRLKHKIVARRDGSDDCPLPLKKPNDSVEKMVSEMAAVDGVSFRTFTTSNVLKRLFLRYGHTLPESPTTIRTIILGYAKDTRVKLMSIFSEFRAAGHLFSLTMDEWTSLGSRRFANINLHCNGKTFCLGLFRCFGSMPADKCRELVFAVLAQYKISPWDIIGKSL